MSDFLLFMKTSQNWISHSRRRRANHSLSNTPKFKFLDYRNIFLKLWRVEKRTLASLSSLAGIFFKCFSSHCVPAVTLNLSTCVSTDVFFPVNWCEKWRCLGFRSFFWVEASENLTRLVSVAHSLVNWPVWISRVVTLALTWTPRSVPPTPREIETVLPRILGELRLDRSSNRRWEDLRRSERCRFLKERC